MRLAIYWLLGLSSAFACNTTLICQTLDMHMVPARPPLKLNLIRSLHHLQTTCTDALNTPKMCDGRDLCADLLLQLWRLKKSPRLPADIRHMAQEMQLYCLRFIPPFEINKGLVVLFIAAIFMLIALLV